MKTTTGPECSICTHPKRKQIERKILASVPMRDIGAQFGMSHTSVERHRENHMTAMVAAAIEAQAVEMVEGGQTIVERCREVNREAWALLNEAKSEQDRKVYASLLGQALKSLELEAKLLGEIGPTTATMNAIQVNVDRGKPLPPWATAMLPALDPPGRAALETACQLVTADSFEETDSEVDEFYRAWVGLRGMR